MVVSVGGAPGVVGGHLVGEASLVEVEGLVKVLVVLSQEMMSSWEFETIM